ERRAEDNYAQVNRPHLSRLIRPALRILIAGALALFGVASAQAQDSAPKVYVMPTSGIVDQFMSGYIRDGLAKAQREGAAAALIELNTPGGVSTATRALRSAPRHA